MQVPVGRETLGRIMNVIGEPVDECGPIGEILEPYSQFKLHTCVRACNSRHLPARPVTD